MTDIEVDVEQRLLIETGKSQDDSGSGVTLFFAGFALLLTIAVFKANSPIVAVFIIGPLVVLCCLIAFPRVFSGEALLISHDDGLVTVETRWLIWKKIRERSIKEFSAILIVEDKVHLLKGMRSRFRLFFCLGPKSVRRRVLYIDDVLSAQEAAKTAKEISSYTGWPLEFLTVDRMLKETDVDWEEW